MRQFRSWIATCALLSISCATVPITGTETSSPPTGTLVAEVAALRNTDVSWNGTWLGLWPDLSDRAARLQASGAAVIPLLREALQDEEQYVAAHVLLTWLTNEPFCLSGSRYNGLSVELYADGRTVIFDQRTSIQRLWNEPRRRSACEPEDALE